MIQKQLNSIICTDGGNNYYLSRNRQGVLFLHPVLKHLIVLYEQGELDSWLNAQTAESSDQVKIDTNTYVSKSQLQYYYRYFQFLVEKGFFDGVEKYPIPLNRYNSEDIKKSLASSQQIIFEVTQSCNLNCTYCGYGEFYDGFDKRDNKNLDLDTAKKLLDYMIVLWESPQNRQYFKNVYISFYGGEPLLNMPFIEEIVNYVKSISLRYKSFCFSMTTNGILLEKYIEFLVANDFRVLISLDGNKENNDYRHYSDGSSSFEKVYNNVLEIKQKYPAYFKKKINFISVIHNKNSDKGVNTFFEKEFHKEPILIPVNSFGIKPSKKEEYEKLFKGMYSDFEDKDFIATAQTKHELLKAPFINLLWSFLQGRSGFIFRQYDHLIRNLKKPWIVSTGTCNPFSRKIFVTANGKILPCERIMEVYSLGSVDQTGVHLDYDAIAAQVNKYFEKLIPQCNDCITSDVCSKCIYFTNLNDKFPTCTSITDGEKFKENVRFQLSTLEEARRYYPVIMKNYQVN